MRDRRALLVGGLVVVAVVVALVVALLGRPDRVVLVGDSIAVETAPYLDGAIDEELDRHVFGGTAPCDWPLDEVGAKDGDLVVVSFTGNSFTTCMADPAGGHLQGDALVAKYAKDLDAMVKGLRAAGAEVLLVGQPERGPGAGGVEEVRGINAIYERLAEQDGVSLVDAGAALETEQGAYAAELPCAPDEPECGPSGRNAVRNPDGVHLCPSTSRGTCDVYSSGAFRFAGAIADAIDTP